jgi:hypothetical protein
MSLRRLFSLSALALCALGLLGATGASAAPIWNLDVHHNQTHFPPGGEGQYWFEAGNVGDVTTSGKIKLTLELPAGITRKAVVPFLATSGHPINWKCPGKAGSSVVVCESSDTIARQTISRGLVVEVNVAPEAEGTLVASATIEGGGAAKADTVLEPAQVDAEPAGFGIVEPSFTPDFLQADGRSPEREAGSHPDVLSVPFDFNSHIPHPVDQPILTAESENIRDLHVDLPPGFIGNPNAVGECTQAEFTVKKCSRSSIVGREDLLVFPLTGGEEEVAGLSVNVYNLSHPRGVITDLAFVVAGNPVHTKVTLDPANRYAITSEVPTINETLPPYNQKITLWGIPADHSHDSEGCGGSFTIDTSKECATDAVPKPFLSVPSQCEADNTFRLHHYDSWDHPGVFGADINYTIPGLIIDCDKPRFEPDVEIEPTGKQANTPTGLDVHIKIAQNENPNAPATPPVKRITVKLPQGMSFSPSFADGLKSCSLAEMKFGTNEPIECPDGARIGEVALHTPLLPKPAEGSMYLAAQGDNPFGSTFAAYLVLHDTEERGALIKIPGRIDVDPVSGQIVTTFEDTPQFPFDDLTLKFRSGPRAPLVSPPTCGKQVIGIEVASYARPQEPVDASNTYEVTEGPNGTPCPPDSARRSFSPKFSGGTLNPVAGAYSPFLFRLSRDDQEQELSQVTTVLPPGLLAKIAGVPYCPAQAIASISTAEGAGAQELAHPACPASSQIGTVSAGLGAGPGPNYFDGKVYLAGPYKGAPLSLAVVAPAIAGPFDLGNVVVRTALYVNPDTAQARAVSDPFPTILHGVILRVRDVRLRVDRPETTINPTNCSRMAVDGQITGVGGSLLSTADDSLFTASSPFQVGGCGDLAFKPKLAFRLFGGTHRGSHPKLRATVTMPPGGSNIASASVALPHSEFLDQGHIGTVCTRVQFAANACPAASIYGTVSAKTPLLDETLTGPIYLRSSNHPLPDIVAAFRGGRIDANLVGRVDSVNGGIRNTFDFVPDVPVSEATFSFFGGSKGLLVNSRNICKGTPKATAIFNAQSGATLTAHPPLKSACGKAKKAKRHQRSSRHR